MSDRELRYVRGMGPLSIRAIRAEYPEATDEVKRLTAERDRWRRLAAAATKREKALMDDFRAMCVGRGRFKDALKCDPAKPGGAK